MQIVLKRRRCDTLGVQTLTLSPLLLHRRDKLFIKREHTLDTLSVVLERFRTVADVDGPIQSVRALTRQGGIAYDQRIKHLAARCLPQLDAFAQDIT
jgi:hypothetical protein